MFSPSPDDIRQQLEALRDHRRNLALYLSQRRQLGKAYIPPGIANGINNERQQIQNIKQILLGWGIVIDDHPDDIETPDTFKTTIAQRFSTLQIILASIIFIISIYIFRGFYNESPVPENEFNPLKTATPRVLFSGPEPKPDRYVPISCGSRVEILQYYSQEQASLHQQWSEQTGNASRASIPLDSRNQAIRKIAICRVDVGQYCSLIKSSCELSCSSNSWIDSSFNTEACESECSRGYNSCLSDAPSTELP